METALYPVVIFIDKGFHDIEVMYAKYRLEEAGFRVFLAGPTSGERYIGKYGYPAVAEIGIHEVQERRFSAAICAGGWAPLTLRTDGKTRRVAISAGICRGLKVAGPAALRDDFINAGANFQETSVVADRNLITARYTSDLPLFMKTVIDAMAGSAEAHEIERTAAV